eukprot:gene24245-29317_t
MDASEEKESSPVLEESDPCEQTKYSDQDKVEKNHERAKSVRKRRYSLDRNHTMEASLGRRRHSFDLNSEVQVETSAVGRRRRLERNHEMEGSLIRRWSFNEDSEMTMKAAAARRRRYLNRNHACETSFRIGYDDNPSKFDAASTPESPRPTLAAAMSQPLQSRHRLEFLVIMIGASLLALNAGFINGSTMLLGGYPSAHVSGTITKAGLDLANGDLEGAYVDCNITISFIVGAAITGVMLKDDKFQLGIAYGPVFLLGSGLLLLASLANFFVPYSNLYFYLATMACGLQNSMTTKYSGSIIRTTHMTGTATDIGLTFGKMLLKDYADSWKLLVLIPLMIAYLVGGVLCVYAYDELAHLTLIINFALFFSIGVIYSIVIGWKLNIPLWKAMLGLYASVGTKVVKGKRKAAKLVRRVGGRLVRFKTHTHKNEATGSVKQETEMTVQAIEVAQTCEYDVVATEDNDNSNKFDYVV